MKIIIGVITQIVDDTEYPKDMYVVKVDIPGTGKDFYAFPKRSEVDEPRVGENVYLTEIDPVWHSYYIYEKIKENDFIGIRSRGKMIKFHDDELTIGIIPEGNWYDDNTGNDPTPSPTSWIKVNKDGSIDINSEGDLGIKISGKSDLTIDDSCNITVKGDCSVKADGGCTIDSPDVKITGGQLTVNGSVSPGSGMPFNCVPTCIFSGAPHGNSIVTGT